MGWCYLSMRNASINFIVPAFCWGRGMNLLAPKLAPNLVMIQARQPFCLSCARPTPTFHCPLHGAVTAHSLYWGIGPAYSLLKRWKYSPFKRSGGLARAIFPETLPVSIAQFARPHLNLGPTTATLLIPIPHTAERTLNLRGSPTRALAEYFAKHINAEITSALELGSLEAGRESAHKGQSDFQNRRLSPKGFKINPRWLQKIKEAQTVILVDDFVTSGATLQEATWILKRAHPELKVLALALALRPRFEMRDLKTPDLSERLAIN